MQPDCKAWAGNLCSSIGMKVCFTKISFVCYFIRLSTHLFIVKYVRMLAWYRNAEHQKRRNKNKSNLIRLSHINCVTYSLSTVGDFMEEAESQGPRTVPELTVSSDFFQDLCQLPNCHCHQSLQDVLRAQKSLRIQGQRVFISTHSTFS